MLSASDQDQARRLAWFRAARFGMFIHWGLYSQLGRHEWVMNRERIPVAEYEKLADTWKPAPGAPRHWARLAKQAGMRYMVMGSKHHEGFCLFDTRHTDYNAVKRGPGRDLVAEYVEAVRAEGLRVGLYYSLMDWHHPDGTRCKHDEAARRRFVEWTHALVRELCSNYGPLDILWFDVNWPLSPEEWEANRLLSMVRKLQPDVIVNDRTGLEGDFGTPENVIEPAPAGRMWEACMTFGDESFGYSPIDNRYKDAWTIVSMLRQVAAGGGNLLLNIGPAPDGSVPEPCERALLEVGAWLQEYGPTVYDATDPMEQDWMLTGAFTRRGDRAYFHCHRWPGTELAIGGLQSRVLEARFYRGAPIRFTQSGDRLVLHGLPEKAPNPLATVIELRMEGVPAQVLGMGCVLIDDDPMHHKS